MENLSENRIYQKKILLLFDDEIHAFLEEIQIFNSDLSKENFKEALYLYSILFIVDKIITTLQDNSTTLDDINYLLSFINLYRYHYKADDLVLDFSKKKSYIKINELYDIVSYSIVNKDYSNLTIELLQSTKEIILETCEDYYIPKRKVVKVLKKIIHLPQPNSNRSLQIV